MIDLQADLLLEEIQDGDKLADITGAAGPWGWGAPTDSIVYALSAEARGYQAGLMAGRLHG